MGGGRRVNPGRGGGKEHLREAGMGGFLMVPLIYYEVEDSQCRRCSDMRGNHRGLRGRDLRLLDTPNEGGGGGAVDVRCGVGSAGLNPRLFSCKYVLLTIWAHVRTYGVGLGVGVDGRGNPETREWSGRVCVCVCEGRTSCTGS